MRVVEGIAELPKAVRRVVALGTFDGVHLGHRALIETARDRARESDAVSTVLTFEPMPVEVLRPGQAPPRLPGSAGARRWSAELGPDELSDRRFDRALASLSPSSSSSASWRAPSRRCTWWWGRTTASATSAVGDTERLAARPRARLHGLEPCRWWRSTASASRPPGSVS